ncbi:MAG: hypothetical protein R3F61_22925 [Myxococcota bacterium]
MRVMLFDRTCTTTGRLPLGLSHSWLVGGRLYRGLGRLDRCHAIGSWAEGLDRLASFDRIDEVQYWGHGNWGLARVANESLDRRALVPGHPLHARLEAVRERMAPQAQWWFRTCDTLGARAGHAFGQAWSDFFGRPVAGHTHIIGLWQSGLHRLEPGCAPHWPASEGITEGTPERPVRSTWSLPSAPNTIHMLQGRVPDGW